MPEALTTCWSVSFVGLMAMLLLLVDHIRITWKQYYGWSAVLVAGGAVVSFANGWTGLMYLHAGVAAWCAWDWWNNGGGDGPQRRLKRWAAGFQGVRRTAPQGAS